MQDVTELAPRPASASDVLKPNLQPSSTIPPMPSSVHDQFMSELARPSLSTSLSDFALPAMGSFSTINSNALASGSKDDTAPVMRRLRRPTLISYLSESRLHLNSSPLSMSFPPRSRKGKERCTDGEEGESNGGEADESDSLRSFRDKDRMLTDNSSPSSESDVNTPPMRLGSSQLDELSDRPKSSPMDMSRSASPASALRPPADILEAGPSRFLARRPSCPPKPARLLSLRAEARPEEVEVKHEAHFQRYLASHAELPPVPGQPRTTRLPSDRGRYPEEAQQEDVFQREDTPSDDGDLNPEIPASFYEYKIPSGSEPIAFTKQSTPAPSMIGTPEDPSGGFAGSPGIGSMDIDLPMAGSLSIPMTLWRQTPPPTAAPVRTNKRKHEDRYEPYAPAKRRAVSPSLMQLRDSGALVSPLIIPRSPVLRSRGSFSQASSTVSSPTVSQSSSMYGNGNCFSNGNGSYVHGHHRSGSSSSALSSPTVRASMILASPVLRPVPRLAKRSDEGERIMDGAGEGMNGLSLGR